MARLDSEQFRVAVEGAAREGMAPAVEAPRVELPAFLERDERTGEYKLPEGYDYLKEGEEAFLRDDVREVVFYFGPHGARVIRGEDDKSKAVFFRLEGVPVPKEGEHTISRLDPSKGMSVVKVETSTSEIPPEGVPLYDGWGVNIREGKGGGPATVGFRELYTESPPYKVVDITPPRKIVSEGEEIDFTDYGSGLVGIVRIKGEKIVIKSEYGKKIAVPAAAMVRPAFAEGYGEARPAGAAASPGEAKAELPAFLERDRRKGGYELPKGYEGVVLAPGQSQLVRVDSTPGSEVICYAENTGVVLFRGEDKRIYFRLKGLVLSQNFSSAGGGLDNITLENIGPEGIPLGGKLKRIDLSVSSWPDSYETQCVGFRSSVWIRIPGIVSVGGTSIAISDLGIFGMGFELDGENIRIENLSKGVDSLRVAVPAGVMVGPAFALTSFGEARPASAESYGEAGEEQVGARAGTGAEAAGISVEQRMAGAIKELVELDKNREVPDLGRRAGKAVAELLTAMGETEPGAITKMAAAALGKENPTDKDVTMFFGRVVGTAVRMKAEITSPTPHQGEAELSISLTSLLVLSKEPDSSSRQEDAGYDLGRILTNLSRVDAGVRDRLVAAGLNKKPEELTAEDLTRFFGQLVGTAVAMRAKM